MVNRCVVCRKISSKSSGKSMHRMPIDSARQKLWMDQLKLKISESSKWVYVCSDHFCDEDFILKFGKKCLKTEAIPSRISLPDPCNTLAASDERYMTQDPSDVGKVRESSKLIGSELSETSDLSATASASDLSATLTASDLSATDMSVALVASDLSGKVDSLEVFDTEKFAAPHTNTSCCTSTASDGRSVTQTLSDIGRVEEFPKLSGSELSNYLNCFRFVCYMQ
ncbi:THAP domain-containing protein 5-like isoform X2 [Coccinella septempunctata]|uniref:THAP domain-containing protein 5-like isoform X2 n=1 Tax=Coccinella septempunctata TaxID=41139 RepID=UPI001D098369|nr:THAP domain-containing protein 5-like isoform X2 [Coccinella septempunctata]